MSSFQMIRHVSEFSNNTPKAEDMKGEVKKINFTTKSGFNLRGLFLCQAEHYLTEYKVRMSSGVTEAFSGFGP